MFVDASALVAVINNEPERAQFALKLERAEQILISPVVIYEVLLAIVRVRRGSLAAERRSLKTFFDGIGAKSVSLDKNIGELALDAHETFGKGRHKAALNMGDCFAYACAKAHKVPLLFKGGDFALTDITVA